MDTTEPSPAAASGAPLAPPPQPPSATPLPSRRRRRGWIVALAGLATLGALVVAGVYSLWWAAFSEPGSAWLLSKVPGLVIVKPKGALGGDFEAERVEVALPGGDKLVLADVGWRGLSLNRFGNASPYLRIVIAALYARRLDLISAPKANAEPLQAPASLRLPFELEIKSLMVGELHAAPLGAQPLRELSAGLHLGAEGGALHRVDALSLVWGKLHAAGSARVGADAAMPLDASIGLAQEAGDTLAAWSSPIRLAGPLRAPLLQATLRTEPPEPGPTTGVGAEAPRVQSLDLRATLKPFESWPLGDLQARTEALDLSAFHAAAPVTALSGEAVVVSRALDQPITVNITLANALAGRWNEGRLPVRSVTVELQGRADDPNTLDLRRVDAELGTQQQAAGTVQGQGRWTPDRWNVDATLKAVQPSLLDARASAMQFSGPVTAVGNGFAAADADAATVDLKADLAGQLSGAVLGTRVKREQPRAVQLKVDARFNPLQVELRDLQARTGGARADLKGTLARTQRTAPWRAVATASLVDFDPSPWWPGREDSPWRKGPHRLNAQADVDLTVPQPTGTPTLAEQLAAVRGQAGLSFSNSLLAGVPLSGELKLSGTDGALAVPLLKLDLAGNRLSAEGRYATAAATATPTSGSADRWDLTLAAPALARLAPLWQLLQPAGADGRLAGSLSASARLNGRWPDVTTQGEFDASALRAGALSLQSAQARWQVGSSLDAAVDAQASVTQLALGEPSIESVQLLLKGTGRAHNLDLRAESRALPPAWTDALQTAQALNAPAAMPANTPPGNTPPASAAVRPPQAPASGATAAPPTARRSVALLQAQGGLQAAQGSAVSGWRGSLNRIEWLDSATNATPWLRARDIALDLQWAGGPTRVSAQPGRVELLGGALRWSRLNWQAAEGNAAGQIDVQADIEPLRVAPLLARAQPNFGWGGDLQLSGSINLRSAPNFSADVVIERQSGDLTVTDEIGTQALGLTDLRVALDAKDGVWSFTQGLAGRTLGVGAGAVVVRTTPQALWPAADAPIQGVLELQVANLGTWGNWVPAGWRLGGELRTSASIGGRFGAPEYTGEIRGKDLSVRNFLEGVNVSEGDVLIALQGTTARIERFKLSAGAGTLQVEGTASLGEAPKAQLKLVADRFQLLGRVDRRVVTSGQAQLRLDRENLALEGQFGIDEALIDFSRSDAPSLGDDVQVQREKTADDPKVTDAAIAKGPATAAPTRKVALDLRVALGDKLRLRGRGLDTLLKGDLHITSPGGRLAVNGTVNAADGTYAAYGQKLGIDRGGITFNGPVDNPRLDIEAVRPDSDVRVGVAVTGTAVNPRIRLFSVPELSEIDKLSWLVMGRGSDGLGSADTALLQRAAVALLSGEGPGVTDQVINAIGLDQVSLKQSDGEVRETVVSLGKNLSRRWYVGYERGLNATAGTWQLIYRIAQRFTLRAQSGLDNSLDVIWTWRWQ
jgi:translocation and assembly module TamB